MSATGTEAVTLKQVADSIGHMLTAGPTPDTVPDVGDCAITVSHLRDLSDYLDSK